ncbi:efflux RND transporter periplasmic adaptor subunit [Prolixibacter sp. SD074]|uniref:efflux RND transporter periplasmic adaptor subunit n=1 Tax=Prolixibacter sp. SD074 TaxID=2652391 RepID=UPI0012766F78|nr:HlyD family efflux transporter periplasmic adaptor subunit [Prolixibacter sp. SD074]GET29204.1 transporter [Prolixibacter sp. SD074]
MKFKSVYIALIALLPLISGCNSENHTSPQRKDIVDAVFASGEVVMSDPYLVTSMSEGYLTQSFVDEGDSVTKGQELFHIQDETQQAQLEDAETTYQHALSNNRPDSPVLKKLNEQIVQARNQLTNDSINFVRYRNLIQSNAVSKAEYDKAKLALENSRINLHVLENSLADTKKNLQVELVNAKTNLVAQQNNSSWFMIRSNVNGIVLQKMKENGELVRKGEAIAQIGSGDFVARLYIAEEDINRVKLGQKVYVELNSEKNSSVPARITKIYPAFSTEEQSFIAEAHFTQPVPGLRSGTQLQANIVVDEKHNALVIPSSYLLPHDYVEIEGRDKKVKIDTGIKTAEWVEVLQGLNEKDVLTLPDEQ